MIFGNLLWPLRRHQLSLSVFAELEDHGEPGLLGKTSLELTMRWRTVANELSMVVVVRGCFQCLAGKS
jgi:hypothetical protein